MKPLLSVIMPCYNCEKTLREAVESCYVQGLLVEEFEVIMVDDGSSDGTRELMVSLGQKYANIKLVFCDQNNGGGAARNTAVTHSKGDVLFCLDSDDILPPQVLQKLYAFLVKEKCDGVLFAETQFFTSNIKNVKKVINKPLDTIVSLEDIYRKDTGFLTQVNFMYTKRAFQIIEGYPTNHGFDTQTFGLKFIAKGLHAIVCPGTHYFHRQHQKGHRSYYEREYERGLISINTYLALEPIVDHLHDSVIDLMIHFDIFLKNYHGAQTNLFDAISSHVQANNPVRRADSDCQNLFAKHFRAICKWINHEDYAQAQQSFTACLREVKKLTPLLLFLQIRISCGLLGNQANRIDDETIGYLERFKLLNHPKYRRVPPLLLKIFKAIQNA
ncbi:glycosyltransferase [Oxalobacter sp. OttesenSCG-928-P03]|nr:glycosyltransferase [Oxalobacter sp. OttesenSCG-928-P03]